MALNVDVIELTQPGATGNQTYNLAAGFDPKAIIIFGTPQTADGGVVSWAYGIGFGTYRGAAVQQRCCAMRGLNGATAADTAGGNFNDAVFKILTQTAGSAAIDCKIDLVSMTNAGTPNVVLNWVNLHTTAGIKIFMIVLGGSDLTDAYAGDVAIAAAGTTQDKTVVAGFGRPDFLFCAGVLDSIGASAVATSPQWAFGFGKQGEAGRGHAFTQTDGNTASIVAASQRDNRIFQKIAPGGASWECIAQLDTVIANWPTDGFRLVFDAVPGFATNMIYLALKGTFQSATGANVAATSGGLPVAQDNACGFAPALGGLLNWSLTAKTTIDIGSTSLVAMGMGATDGTTEGWAGFAEDDAAGTMISKQQRSAAKVIANYDPSVGAGVAVQSEADGLFSGNNFRLSWTDIDTISVEYQWFALGSAAASGSTVEFEAIVAGQGSVGVEATPLRGLAAALAGQGAVSAAVARERALSAIVAGQGQVGAALARQLSLLADVSGQGAVVVEMGRTIPLAATVAGLGQISVDLNRVKLLEATVIGQGQVVAALSLTKALAAAIAGNGTVVAQADRTRGLAAAVAAIGQIAALHSPLRGLAATVGGQGAVTVDIQKLGLINLDAAVQAQGSVSASMNFVRTLEAAVTGQATIVASLRATRALAAVVAGQGQITASVGLSKRLAATVQAQGAIVVSIDAFQKWLIPKTPDVVDLPVATEDAVLLWTVVDDTIVLTAAGEDVLSPPAAGSDTLVLVGQEEEEH